MDHDADLALAVIAGDGRINEAQRGVESIITMTIATQQPVARDLRFLLALDHVDLRARAHRRPRRLGGQAGPQARAAAAAAGTGDLARMAAAGARLVHGVLLALVDVDEVRAREVAAGDDEVDNLYHELFDRILELMRRIPPTWSRGRASCRRPLPRADRRPGHQHRRGRRLPRHRRRSRTSTSDAAGAGRPSSSTCSATLTPATRAVGTAPTTPAAVGQGAPAGRTPGRVPRRTGLRPRHRPHQPRGPRPETADLVAGALGREVHEDDRLRGPFGLGELEALLDDRHDPRRPLLVGHDPDFTAVLTLLVGAPVPLRKGALARVDLPSRPVPGGGTLRWLIPPDALEAT